MKKMMIFLLAAALVITTSAAFGAVKEGSFTVTPLVGGYVFDDDQSLDPTLVVGIRGGYNFTKHFGIEALYDYATRTDASSGPLTDISLHRFGGQALYHFFPDNNFVPYLAAGFSGLKFEGDGVGHKVHGALDYGVGAKYFLTDDFAIRGDVRHILYRDNSDTMNHIEFTLGAYIQFGATPPVAKAIAPEPAPAPAPEPKPVKVEVIPVPAPPGDSDNDGVNDSLDKCPGTPSGVAVDSNGCPVDSDKDGVPDYLDKCPGTPAGVAVDAKGCPIDSDNDGVPDYLDKCPGTPAGVAVDSKGCPVDSDKDGIPDYLDKCTGTPAGVAVNAEGCPVDTDNDGVPNYLDKCPGTQAGVAVDAKGCPVEAAKQFCDKPAIIAISFDTGKADVQAKYHEELDKVAQFLKEFPNSKGTIDGYTDNVGNKASNIKLSQRRADSVRNYILKTSGIAPERITATGYGPAKPLADNKTKEGKAQNRRIEANFSCE